jgi:protein-L-isoaspartate O-methyltransferase
VNQDTATATKGQFKRHDALCSFAERVEQLQQRTNMTDRTRANLIRALDTVDPARREAFLAKFGERLEDIETLAAIKYADLGYWAHRNVLLAQWLDLDHSPPLDILDIGTGSGNFAMVAQSMGHRAIGSDLSDPWYEELCHLTGVERVVAPVKRGEPYKPVDRRFDLITIMLPAFHRKTVAGKRQYWSIEDWRQFLLGLVRDLLKPEGAIFILMPLDKDDEGKLSYSPLVEWARDRGARLDRTTPKGPVRHVLFDPATEATFAEEPPEVAVKSDIELNLPDQ